MENAVAWVIENKVVVVAALFFLSEVIGMVPTIKASGVFQAIYNAIKYLYEKVVATQPPEIK